MGLHVEREIGELALREAVERDLRDWGLPISAQLVPSAYYWLQARGQITLDLKNTHNRFSPLVRGCQFYLFLLKGKKRYEKLGRRSKEETGSCPV